MLLDVVFDKGLFIFVHGTGVLRKFDLNISKLHKYSGMKFLNRPQNLGLKGKLQVHTRSNETKQNNSLKELIVKKSHDWVLGFFEMFR